MLFHVCHIYIYGLSSSFSFELFSPGGFSSIFWEGTLDVFFGGTCGNVADVQVPPSNKSTFY